MRKKNKLTVGAIIITNIQLLLWTVVFILFPLWLIKILIQGII